MREHPEDDRLRWEGARRPARAPIEGAHVRLEPLDADRHVDALFEAAWEPALWTYMPVGPFPDRAAFAAWAEEAAPSTDPLFLVVVEQPAGRPSGMASYLRITPEHGTIEIGHIWFGPALQRTHAATEAIFLLARHAFDDLGYRRLEWKCNARNAASRRAAERFGFRHEGVFRRHMVVKGRNRDTAWYSIVDEEWPRCRAAFEAWLAPANFDDDGRQRRSLADVRAALDGPASEEGS